LVKKRKVQKILQKFTKETSNWNRFSIFIAVSPHPRLFSNATSPISELPEGRSCADSLDVISGGSEWLAAIYASAIVVMMCDVESAR
jgi:hypothetical protein